MSEILNILDVNDYGLQSMKASGGGGEAEDLTIELGAQDTALSAQQSKIDELESALDDKIALDLADATSDADATAGDIAKNKTAYVNGVKLVGSADIGGYKLPNGATFRNNNVVETIPNNVDISDVIDGSSFLYQCLKLVSADFSGRDTHSLKRMNYFAGNSTQLVTLNLANIDVSNVTTIDNFASGCTALVNLNLANWNLSSITIGQTDCFKNCTSLSDESLNYILGALSTITQIKYPQYRTLKFVGLTSTQATTCQTLSNWDAFVAAGWSSRILERRNKKCQQEQIKKEYLRIMKLYQKITQI